MASLTPSQAAALVIIEKSKNEVGWNYIARRLDPTEFPNEEVNPVSILCDLEKMGFIERSRSESIHPTYKISKDHRR